MSKTIWKFPIPLHQLDDVVSVEMPQGARALDAREQHGQLCIWALVDPGAEKVSRQFMIVGTGHQRRDLGDAVYLGAAHLQGGSLVFHVFEPASR